MGLKDDMKDDAKQYGKDKGGDFFQFEKSGVYRLRLLSKPYAIATHFFGPGKPSSVCYGEGKGCPFHGDKAPSVKYMAYVLDRLDGKIKLGELPYSVLGAIADFEDDEDFGFTGYPMPFDVKVTVDKENTDPKAIYKTLGSPKRVELTSDEVIELTDKLKKLMPEAFVEKRKEKQLEKHKLDGTWDREQERRVKFQAEIDEAKKAFAHAPESADDEDDSGLANIPF